MGGIVSSIFGTNSQVPVGPQQQLQTQDLRPYLQTLQGQQQGLYNQLQQQALGQGPNPATQMLQQATQQNAAQAAQSFAGNRSINPGLAAKMASGLQSQGNQAAAGQAALIRAQQQLAAQQQMGQMNLGASQIAQGAQAAQNSAFGQENAINAGIAASNQQASNGLLGGLLSAVGPAAKLVGLAHGGRVSGYSDGGSVGSNDESVGDFAAKSAIGGLLGSIFSRPNSSGSGGYFPHFGGGGYVNQSPDFLATGFSPGQEPLVSAPMAPVTPAPTAPQPGPSGPSWAQQHLGPKSTFGKLLGGFQNGLKSFGGGADSGMSNVQNFMALARARGGMIPQNMLAGGGVPGRAQTRGDSLKNDTVPAMLSPGEIVVPRSASSDPDAAKRFVQQVLAKRKGKK